MSVATTERTVVGADSGSDLASLVVAYHRRAHTADAIGECPEKMCQVAQSCVDLDAMFYGVDV